MKEYEDFVQLLKEVQGSCGHILNCSNESICEYQDMIGHSSEEQLTELANGIYKETFYRVYGLAYGTCEALRFYVKHSEKINEILAKNSDLEADLEAEKFYREEDKKEIMRLKSLCNQAAREKEENDKKLKKAEEEIKAQAEEIKELKAKLYDLIIKK